VDKVVIRRKDVARLLDISESTVFRWSKEGYLPAPFAFGPNRTVWLYSEILEFVDKLKANRGYV
jgi:predicted DNA-binding transcriptional regulator AlpA